MGLSWLAELTTCNLPPWSRTSQAQPPDDCGAVGRSRRQSEAQVRSQETQHWYEQIADPTIADGIPDCLVHNAHRIEMRGGVHAKSWSA